MRIPDIFALNDWNIKKFNICVLVTIIIYDITVITGKLISGIVMLQSLVGFIIITFMPGYLSLRILRIHNLDRVTNLLLAVGLSLSFMMIYGFFLNLLLPPLGLSRPISFEPLFYAINIGMLIAILVSYFRDREFKSKQQLLHVSECISAFPLVLLPLLSVFAAYVMNFYNLNAVTLFTLLLISLVPMLIAFNKFPENFYPLLVFMVSISILYNVNFTSEFLTSYDIFFEYYSANLVLGEGLWNTSLDGSTPLLLFGILAPIYSLQCNLDLVWVLKIFFPFLFALVPPALYQTYKSIDFGDFKLHPKPALLSVFVFVFFYGFFKDMPDKQHIAELFLALILMLAVMKIPKSPVIAFLFSFSLITSHYGVSYVFMFALFFVLVISNITKREEVSILTPNFALWFFVLAIGWYLYVTSGAIFEAVTLLGNHILSTLAGILTPDARSGATYLLYETQRPTWLAYTFIQLVLQGFVGIGVLKLTISLLKDKIKNIGIPLVMIAFYFLLIFQVTKTYGMGFDRVLQITLTLLSPLALIGFRSLFEIVYKNIKWRSTSPTILKLFAVFLTTFFIFNSGLTFALVGDIIPPYCIALDKDSGWPVYDSSEVQSIIWLKTYGADDNIGVYSPWNVIKSRDGLLVAAFYPENALIKISDTAGELTSSYIFLGKVVTEVKNTAFYSKMLPKLSKIYDSGGPTIYFVR